MAKYRSMQDVLNAAIKRGDSPLPPVSSPGAPAAGRYSSIGDVFRSQGSVAPRSAVELDNERRARAGVPQQGVQGAGTGPADAGVAAPAPLRVKTPTSLRPAGVLAAVDPQKIPGHVATDAWSYQPSPPGPAYNAGQERSGLSRDEYDAAVRSGARSRREAAEGISQAASPNTALVRGRKAQSISAAAEQAQESEPHSALDRGKAARQKDESEYKRLLGYDVAGAKAESERLRNMHERASNAFRDRQAEFEQGGVFRPGFGVPQRSTAAAAELDQYKKLMDDLSARGESLRRDIKLAEEVQKADKYASYAYEEDYRQFSIPRAPIQGDDIFNIINNFGVTPEQQELYAAGRRDLDRSVRDDRFNALTDDERGIYNYLYAKQGKKAADEFLDFMEDTLTYRNATLTYEGMGAVGKALFAPLAGIDRFVGGVAQAFSKDEKPLRAAAVTGGLIRQEAYDKSKLLGLAYDLGDMAGNLAPSILLTSVTSGLLTGAGVSAATAATAARGASIALNTTSRVGNIYAQKLKEGHSPERAKSYAVVTGAVSSGIQYLLGGHRALGGLAADKLGEGIAKLDSAIWRATANLSARMTLQAVSSSMQTVLPHVFASVMLDEDIDISSDEVWTAALMGALTVAVLEGPRIAQAEHARYIADRAVLEEIRREYMGGHDVDYFEGLHDKNYRGTDKAAIEARFREQAKLLHSDTHPGKKDSDMQALNNQRAFFKAQWIAEEALRGAGQNIAAAPPTEPAAQAGSNVKALSLPEPPRGAVQPASGAAGAKPGTGGALSLPEPPGGTAPMSAAGKGLSLPLTTQQQYELAADPRVLELVESVMRDGPKGATPVTVGNVDKAHADVLRELTGNDYSGFKIDMTGDTVQHILNRHGENGNADQSMANALDIARLGWVIEHFDEVALAGKTNAYRNSDNTPADIVLLRKRINGFYYVAEAVPDSRRGTVFLQSAYKNKTLDGAGWISVSPQANVLNDTSSGFVVNKAAGGARLAEKATPPNVRDLPTDSSASDEASALFLTRPFAGEGVTESRNAGNLGSNVPQGGAGVNNDFYNNNNIGGVSNAGEISEKPEARGAERFEPATTAGPAERGGAALERGANAGGGLEAGAGGGAAGGSAGARGGVSDGVGGRSSGTGPGVEARSVERGSGGGQRQASLQGRVARDRRNNASVLRFSRISARDLGLTQGTEARLSVYYPEDLWDDALKLTDARILKDTGLHVDFVVGAIEVMGSDGLPRLVHGAYTGDDFIVRVDHLQYSADQIADHELFHHMAETVPGLRGHVMERLEGRFSKKEFADITKLYTLELRGVIDVPEDEGAPGWQAAVQAVEDEILADIFAGMNKFGFDADRFTDDVRDAVSNYNAPMGAGHEAAAAVDRTTGPPAGRGGYSINGGFADEVQAWFDSTEPDDMMVSPGYFTVGTTSEPLRGIGVRDGKVYWRKSKIGYILNEHPEISVDTVKQVPLILESPVAVLKSMTRDDSIVLFGELYAGNGQEVMASLELTPAPAGGMETEFSIISSAYGRRPANIKALVENSEILYFDPDKKRTNAWLMQLGVQFPSRQPALGSDGTDARLMQLRVQFPSGQPTLGSIGKVTYSGNDVKIEGVSFSELMDTKNVNSKFSLDDAGERDGGEAPAPFVKGPEWIVEGLDKADLMRAGAPSRKALKANELQVRKKFIDSSLREFSIPQKDRGWARELLGGLASKLRSGGPTDLKAVGDVFDELLEAGRVIPDNYLEFKDVADELRGQRIYVSPGVKIEYGDDWNSVRKTAFGKGVYFTNNKADQALDVINIELAEMYPGFFREDSTDMTAVLGSIMDILTGSEPITHKQNARRQGGGNAGQEFELRMRRDFNNIIGEYYTGVYDAEDYRRSELAKAAAASDEALRKYGGAMQEIRAAREATRTASQRKDPAMTKEEFRGTLSVMGEGINIDGALGNYGAAPSVAANRQAAYKTKKAVWEAEKRLRPTDDEKEFARGLVAGHNDMSGLPASMDPGRVSALADYYSAEESFAHNPLSEIRNEINAALDEQMAELFADSDQFKPLGAVKQNFMTPERVMRRIFRDSDKNPERGEAINRAIFYRVDANEAERYRWKNKIVEKLSRHEDARGRRQPLSTLEDRVVKWVMEGKAASEIVAGLEMKESIINAATNISKGAAPEDAGREFSLDRDGRRLAVLYSRWLDAQDAIRDGKVDSVKVENAVKAYQEFYNDMYAVMNEFLVAHGYEPIGFIKGYVPHMQEPDILEKLNTALKSIMGIQDDAESIPTAFAGLSQDMKPYKRWSPFHESRYGEDDDAKIGIGYRTDRYLDHESDILYHTDDNMRARAVSRYIRRTYSPQERRENLSWAEGLRHGTHEEKLSFLRENGVISRASALSDEDIDIALERFIGEEYDKIQNSGKYSELVKFFDNYANILAGKRNWFDRSSEWLVGRSNMSIGNKIHRVFQRAQVAGSFPSAVRQLSQVSIIAGEVGKKHVAQALYEIMTGKLRRDGFIGQSDYLTGKKGQEYLSNSVGQMIMGAMFTPAKMVDAFTSELAVRSRYLQEVAAGKSYDEAMRIADRYGRSVVGSRMKGSKPLVFESSAFFLKMATMFQLEIANKYDHFRYDVPDDFREMVREHGKTRAIASLAGTIVQMLFLGFLVNRALKEVSGVEPALFDLGGLAAHFMASGYGMETNDWLMAVIDNGWEKLTGERLFDTDRLDPEREFKAGSALADAGARVLNDLPYARNIAGLLGLNNDRPALPNITGPVMGVYNAITKRDDEDGGMVPAEVMRALIGLGAEVLPGGRQIKRTYEGVEAIQRGGSYNGYGDDARLRYPVEGGFWNTVRASMFGTRALPETDRFYASGNAALSKKQTALFDSLVEGGADRGELYGAFMEWRRIAADKGPDMDSLTRGVQQRDVITGLDLSDKQRLELHQGLTGAEKRTDKFERVMKTGLSWSKTVEAYNKWAELNEDDKLKPSEKAVAFAKWVDGKKFTLSQAATVKEQFKFSITLPVEATRYESLTAAGLSSGDASVIAEALQNLEPLPGHTGVTDMQRYRVIDNARISAGDKVAAIGTIMGTEMETDNGNPSQYAKMLSVIDSGASVREYLGLREKDGVDRYLSYIDAGVSYASALDMADAMAEARIEAGDDWRKALPRWRAAVDAANSQEDQLAALSVAMDETNYWKATTAYSYGISPRQYIRFKELLKEIDAAGNNNGSIDQKEAAAAISRMQGLTSTQKAVLYQLQSIGWKTNPYNNSVAKNVRDAYERTRTARQSSAPQPLSLPSPPGAGSLPTPPQSPRGLSLPPPPGRAG